VCTRELIALKTMTNVLSYLKIQRVDHAEVSKAKRVTPYSVFTFHG